MGPGNRRRSERVGNELRDLDHHSRRWDHHPVTRRFPRTIPTYAASSSAGVSATWVGIGGVNSRNVPLRVSPGDSISVSIAEQSASNWLISFKNKTTGQ